MQLPSLPAKYINDNEDGPWAGNVHMRIRQLFPNKFIRYKDPYEDESIILSLTERWERNREIDEDGNHNLESFVDRISRDYADRTRYFPMIQNIKIDGDIIYVSISLFNEQALIDHGYYT